MAFLNTDPQILILAFLGGIIPSLLWLWFWLNEEERPEPNSLIAIVFVMGMLAVIITLPIEKFIQENFKMQTSQLILWACTEELLKYLAVLVILYKTKIATKPIDWPIYLITAALGFAALENAFFLIKPFTQSGAVVALLTGQLRFIGSTLLHTISSGIIGLAIGYSFYMKQFGRKIFLLMGFVVAIALHSAFNFFIIRNNGIDFLKVFAFLWVLTIIVLLLFEKIRRMSEDY